MDEKQNLTEWTQAYYRGFKPIPYVEIRQNPENQDEWQVRRSLNFAYKHRNSMVTKRAGKLISVSKTHTGKDKNGNHCAWYQYFQLFNLQKRRKYWLHTVIRHTYPSLIPNGYNAKDFPVIDHLDRNGLNNKLENLKASDQSMNGQNKLGRGISKYKGVSFCKNRPNKPWKTQVVFKDFRKRKTFVTEIEAAIHYDIETLKIFQLHNAGTPLLNFPEKLEEYLDTIKNKGQLELKF
tara:strand:- start:885 stop:1592 length:708 start_codon:yes stop_codon:yes gene_type:complete